MVRIQSVPYLSKISDSQVWVGSPSVPISGSNMAERGEMLISPVAGAGPLFIGGSNVSRLTGTPIALGESISIPFAGSIYIYGTGSTTGSVDVRIIEFG